MTGSVTVVIPNYNRTNLLEKCLSSILAQTRQVEEVIVIDDHSEQQKFEEIQCIVENFSKNIDIKLLRNGTNKGANYSRNRGIFAAKSDYIAFIDSDDFWMPQKIELQMKAIERHKTLGSTPVFSATGRYRVNGEGQIICRQFGGKRISSAKIRRSNFIGTLSSVIVETWVARFLGGFNERLPACQDWDFFIRLTDYATYIGVPEPLCIYFDHDGARITLNNKKRLSAHIEIYKMHLRNFGAKNTLSHEFLRNIAEDYQCQGDHDRSIRYFAKSILAKTLPKCDLPKKYKNIVENIMLHVIKMRGMPDIRQARYTRYDTIMAKILRNKTSNEKIMKDQNHIHALLK
ncbi:glycosyltransferase family A protein [Roseibium sp. RP-7]